MAAQLCGQGIPRRQGVRDVRSEGVDPELGPSPWSKFVVADKWAEMDRPAVTFGDVVETARRLWWHSSALGGLEQVRTDLAFQA